MFLLLPSERIFDRTFTFDPPIDAVSLGIQGEEIRLALLDPTEKYRSNWVPFIIERETYPLPHESSPILFSFEVTDLRIRGRTKGYTLHPLRITRDPIRLSLASTEPPPAHPVILSRQEWGADESLLFRSPPGIPFDTASATVKPVDRSDVPQRIVDCQRLQQRFPEEFKTTRRIVREQEGKTYRWPLEYSKRISLLVLHHTALKVLGDARPAVERVRALYQYHAGTLGWGDIGYNVLIDEDGTIYEGRLGGDSVVGGHAYCFNHGTIGIALLGNFEEEVPTEAQVQSLQELLASLLEKYGLTNKRTVRFHGKILHPITRHKDLAATDCPGYFLASATSQIERNVITGSLKAVVNFPKPVTGTYIDRTEERRKARLKERAQGREGRGRLSRTSRRILEQERMRQPSEKKEPLIRIRLETKGQGITIALPSNATIGGKEVSRGDLLLTQRGASCEAQRGGEILEAGTIRIVPEDGLFTLTSAPEEKQSYRGTLECRIINGTLVLINELPIEEYLRGLSEESDTEPFEKQKTIAVAARSYAAHYLDPRNRKFPGMPYDGDDSAARFQLYGGSSFEEQNPKWVQAVEETKGQVITKDGAIVKAAYFTSSDGRTRSPEEVGWMNFPFAEIFRSKEDPWCKGLPLQGHGVGMSGCGAHAQALEGKTATEILQYYYPETALEKRW